MELRKYLDEQIAARPTEATLIRKIVRALKKAGTPIVKGYDREEWVTFEKESDVLDFAFNLDEFFLYTEDGAMVWVIMGQGAEGLTDYSVSLEEAFEAYGLNDWIDRNMD